MRVSREVEHTYDPAPDAAVPDLRALPLVARIGEPAVTELEAMYFDTASLALSRSGVSLRRRMGGTDAGWHLKVPAGPGRDELHLPLSRAVHVPPKQLRTAVSAWATGDPLIPVAVIRTRRTTYQVLDDAGCVLAELVDDVVHGGDVREGRASSWREWELELVDGDPSLLEAADRLMAELGAPLADVQRKIIRVLGEAADQHPRVRDVRPAKPAGRVLHRRLADLVAELKVCDSRVRVGSTGVHKTRVALRRLRAALTSFRPLLDRGSVDALRGELRWAARELGVARDAEVAHAVLIDAVDREPVDLVVGPVRRHVERDLDATHREALATVREVMASDRYLALLASLDDLVLAPPWTATAHEPARTVLPGRVKKDWKRVRRRIRVAAAEPPGTPGRARALHEARKAAKRLRYCAEAMEPVLGKRARRMAKSAKRLASVLGEHHDAVVARDWLVRIATEANVAGEPSFTYGRLHRGFEIRAADLERAADRAWHRLSRRKLRS